VRVTVAAYLIVCGCAAAPHGAVAADGGSAASDGSVDGGDGSDGSDGGAFCVAGGSAVLPAGVTVDAAGRHFQRDCAGYSLEVSLVDDGTVRLRRLEPGATARRSWSVIGDELPITAQAGSAPDGSLVICTDTLSLRVDAACEVSLDELVAGDAYDASAHTITHALAADTHLFGLGSQTGALDRRGRSFTLRNTDPYDPAHGGFPPDAATLYPSIPFFIGLRDGTSWGVFVDDTRQLDLDLGRADPSRLAIHTGGGAVDEYLFAGPRMADVLERYTRLTGRPTLPPRWTLGFHQSRWGWYPDSQVEQIAATFRQRHIPVDGLWLDIQHMDGFRSFTWDPTGFSDPAGLIQSLAGEGFKTTIIVDPGIKIDPAWDVYQAGLAAHAFVPAGGDPYTGTAWPGAVVFPDFSAAVVRDWWAGLVARPLALGVRGLWIDMNEPTNTAGGAVPDNLAVDGDGQPATMAELHNAYALFEAQATFAGMKAAAPGRRPFIISRAGYAGLQRYAGLWTGDAPSEFATLAETPAMLMGLGLSGIPMVGSDVGGYSGHATPELYARWMEVGAISPFFRAHETRDVPAQEPWALGPEVEALSRTTITERYGLLPYFYSLFARAATAGEPLLRPLVYDFPHDAGALAADDEAMLGPFILYAPVVQAGAASRAVYLPPGAWYELRSGRPYAGGATVTRNVTLAELPAFVRGGAILPRAPAMAYSDEKPLDPLTLDVWPDDTPSRFAFYEDAGDGDGAGATTDYALSGTATGARLSAGGRSGAFVPPARTLVVRVHAVGAAPTGATLDGAAIAFVYDPDDAVASVQFADRDPFTLEVTYDRSAPIPPQVGVPVRVTVPAGTPANQPIYISTSAGGWMQQPLTWNGDGSAGGVVQVPRGEWLQYKYTRGDWSTVEKGADCSELANRYVLDAAHPGVDDVVARWADGCH
jgi:alpha-glucosidase